MKYDSKAVGKMLVDRVDAVCRFLLPNGRPVNGEWTAGDTSGSAGNSLKVRLTGEKAGVWADFASDTDRGDLLDLWQLSKGVSFIEAFKQAKQFLGIKEAEYANPAKSYSKPKRDGVRGMSPIGPVKAYLTFKRKLSPATLEAFKIAQKGEDGIVFPSLSPDGELLFLKTLKVDRVDGKKVTWVEKGCAPALFGWQAVPKTAREVIICEGECYSGDTEVLTPLGWISLDAYTDQPVAQVSETGGEFTLPIAKIVTPHCDGLLRFENPQVDLLVTGGHNVVTLMPGGAWKKSAASSIRSQRSIPKTTTIDGPGIPLTDDQIRLCIAVSADAKVDQRNGTGWHKPKEMRYCHFGLKKERKRERLRKLLEGLGIEWHSGFGSGYEYFSFSIPDWIPGRLLPWEWIHQMSLAQRKLVLDELVHWDGNRVPNRNQTEYSSKCKHNADWVQALAFTSGISATIIQRRNRYGEWLKVSLLHSKTTASINAPQQVEYSGNVYCLTVPSGALLVRRNGKVCVCGNCDAMSWYQYGFPALSVPFGAGGGAKADWIDYEWENLEPFETIYLAYDNDDAGQACMEEIASRLGIQRCRVVKTPRKDCNECLVSGVSSDDMARCLAAAQWVDRPEVSRPTEFSDEVKDLFDLSLPPSGFACSQFREFVRFRPKETTIWTGISGHGKSTVLSHVMMEAVNSGLRVGVASLEIPPANTLAVMGRQLYGRSDLSPSEVDAFLNWLSGKLWIFNIVGSTEREKLLELVRYARARHNIDHFVIDSLMKLNIAGDDYDAQRSFLNEITGIAIKTACHIHLVAHPRKGSDESYRPGKLDIKGSSDIFNQADNVVSVWRNKVKEEKRMEGKSDESEPDTIIYCDKQRLTGWEGSAKLWFEAAARQFTTKRDAGPRAYITSMPSMEEIVSGMPELPPDPRMSDA